MQLLRKFNLTIINLGMIHLHHNYLIPPSQENVNEVLAVFKVLKK